MMVEAERGPLSSKSIKTGDKDIIFKSIIPLYHSKNMR